LKLATARIWGTESAVLVLHSDEPVSLMRPDTTIRHINGAGGSLSGLRPLFQAFRRLRDESLYLLGTLS
jgi:hypothetical protein